MASKSDNRSYKKPTVKKTLTKPRKSNTKPEPAKATKPRARDKGRAVAMAEAVREALENVGKHPGGRPTDYLPQYAALAEKLCQLNVGITDKDLAEFFEVCEATINNWKLSHPEFLESIRNGKKISDVEVANALYRRATGATYVEEKEVKRKVVEYDPDNPGKKLREEEIVEVVPLLKQAPPDAVAGKYWLNNRQPKMWREKIDLTHGGGDNPIQTEEVGFGFARKVAFLLEKAARTAAAAKAIADGTVDDAVAK